MGSPERENIAPLGKEVLRDLERIDVAATNAERVQERVLALEDGLKLRQSIITEINGITERSP